VRELASDRASRLQQLAPDSAEAHELLARSLESRGKLDEALIEYRAALLSSAGARRSSAWIARKSDWSTCAAQSLHWKCIRHWGKHTALGKHRDALEQFRIVARARPNDDSAHAQLAGEYRALGDLLQAKAELGFNGSCFRRRRLQDLEARGRVRMRISYVVQQGSPKSRSFRSFGCSRESSSSIARPVR
jgi:Flp pilus assembly protein TadD